MSLLREGDRGEAVREIQEQLNHHGAALSADGIYGPKTAAAVRAFQGEAGLVQDGIAGPKTRAALQGENSEKEPLSQSDMARAADKLGVDVAAVMAVNEVESRGQGFLPNGRPAILFERHIMRRQLISRAINVHPYERDHPDLVNASPGGYQGGSAEHDRLEAAKQIDREAAQEACSWGLFQIMGFHWKRLGYASISTMTQQMAASEAAQLGAFVRFIESDRRLHQALKDKDWADFARRYNGPAYKRNRYNERMAEAYQRHQEALA